MSLEFHSRLTKKLDQTDKQKNAQSPRKNTIKICKYVLEKGAKKLLRRKDNVYIIPYNSASACLHFNRKNKSNHWAGIGGMH